MFIWWSQKHKYWEVSASRDSRRAFLPDILLQSGAKLQIQKHIVNSREKTLFITLTPTQSWAQSLGSGAMGYRRVEAACDLPSMIYTGVYF